jgi:hypothetical protein
MLYRLPLQANVYKGIFIWSLMVASLCTWAQDYTLATIKNSDTTYLEVADSFEVNLRIRSNITALRKTGHFAASIDSISFREDTVWANIHIGNKYKTLHVIEHNISNEYLPKNRQVSMNIGTFERLQKQLILDYQNNGYPFAQLLLKNNYTTGDTLHTSLRFDPYIKFEYDTLVYNGNSTISKKYLAKYLAIEPGMLYDERAILSIDKKLRNLPLVKTTGATRVVFFQGTVRVILRIEDVITDRLDGIVGLAPNSNNSAENQLLITGEINIELNNLFKSGKQLELHWRNYLQNSQKLDVRFAYPYLFNTKLGVSSEFNLNKFDTLFVNLMGKISLRYQQQGNNYFQIYYQNVSSNLLNADTSRIRTTKSIPTNNPYSIDNYGIAVFQQDFDYLPNPRQGYKILADVAIGQKQIVRNADIRRVKFINAENSQFISVYDTAQLKSTRLDIKLSASYFIPIKERGTFLQKLSFNGLFASQLFFNELYNFGGYSSLRGFDENELFASKALTYTAEYRYLIGENSNVGLFINTAFLENKIESNSLLFDVPYGFGASANIQVGKGILNLAYALGSQQGNALKLSAAKFHFGVINYF